MALDASTIDVVFSDSDGMQGGFVDDNSGLDYHIAVANDNGHVEKLKVQLLCILKMYIVLHGGGMTVYLQNFSAGGASER